jgi:hypothetical protein
MLTANETDAPRAKEKPSEVDAKDAVNACKQGIGVLYGVLEAKDVFDDDREEALGLAATHLHAQVNIL